MRPRPKLFNPLPPLRALPLRTRPRARLERVLVELDTRKALHELDEEERHLVVRELLSEADPRAGVEGEEDEWIAGNVFDAFVEPSVGIKGGGWKTRGS